MPGQNDDMQSMARRLKEPLSSYFASAQFVGARYVTATPQSFGSGVGAVVNYNTLNDDPLGLVTTGPGWVFSCPVSGRYGVTAAILFDGVTGWAAGEAASLILRRNGVDYCFLDRLDNLSGGVLQYMRLGSSDYVVCAAGDTLQIVAGQSSGVTLTLFPSVVYNYVSIVRVG